MCRNIQNLFNFDPPASEDEIRAAALQFVRKVSGFTKPSQANEEAFNKAVDDIAAVTMTLLDSLTNPCRPQESRRRNRQATCTECQNDFFSSLLFANRLQGL